MLPYLFLAADFLAAFLAVFFAAGFLAAFLTAFFALFFTATFAPLIDKIKFVTNNSASSFTCQDFYARREEKRARSLGVVALRVTPVIDRFFTAEHVFVCDDRLVPGVTTSLLSVFSPWGEERPVTIFPFTGPARMSITRIRESMIDSHRRRVRWTMISKTVKRGILRPLAWR